MEQTKSPRTCNEILRVAESDWSLAELGLLILDFPCPPFNLYSS